MSGDCRGQGGRGGGRDFQVTDHFGARRNPASRWMQRADEGKVDISTRRSSRTKAAALLLVLALAMAPLNWRTASRLPLKLKRSKGTSWRPAAWSMTARMRL